MDRVRQNCQHFLESVEKVSLLSTPWTPLGWKFYELLNHFLLSNAVHIGIIPYRFSFFLLLVFALWMDHHFSYFAPMNIGHCFYSTLYQHIRVLFNIFNKFSFLTFIYIFSYSLYFILQIYSGLWFPYVRFVLFFASFSFFFLLFLLYFIFSFSSRYNYFKFFFYLELHFF